MNYIRSHCIKEVYGSRYIYSYKFTKMNQLYYVLDDSKDELDMLIATFIMSSRRGVMVV